MWRWIKHCRDWVMSELLPRTLLRTSQALHFSYEKAGLKVDDQPIPWNAEAVLVEASVRLPASGRDRTDVTLRGLEQGPVHPESMRRDTAHSPFRIFFRIPPPQRPTRVELFWLDRNLGVLDLPILSREEFFAHLEISMPTLTVNLGRRSVACRSFVSAQSKGFMASAVLTSLTPLAPLADQELEVEFRSERFPNSQRVPVELASSQMQSKEALITACPHKLPKRIGPWIAEWFLEGESLAMQRIRAVSKPHFERSLRISETRYVVQDRSGKVQLLRQLPEANRTARLGPCFLLSSRDLGMAGLCTLQIHAVIPDAVQPPLLFEQEVLITDGPTPFVPGTLSAAELEQLEGFELRLGRRILGMLPMTPAPTAKFTNEGGFKPAMEFTWSSAAEDQLAERLSKLMEE